MWNSKTNVTPIIGTTEAIAKSFRNYLSNIRKARNQGTTQNSHTGHGTHTSESTDVNKSREHAALEITLCVPQIVAVGRDSSVGIATRNRLDGQRIEFRLGRDFPHLSRPALGPTQPPVQWAPSLFSGG
jgi:hypothetical protein